MKRIAFVSAIFGLAVLGAGTARAGETCYGFSGQTDGQIFGLGDTVTAEHLKMHVRDYVRGGANPAPGSQQIKVQSTRLAGSQAAEKSELYIYNATMQIVPHQPVAQISLRVAENRGTPAAGRHANLEINGTVHEIVGGIRHLDGQEFGNQANGRVRVEVKLRSHGTGSDWFDGTLQVRALSGRIASFAIGSTPMVVDDVCFVPNPS